MSYNNYIQLFIRDIENERRRLQTKIDNLTITIKKIKGYENKAKKEYFKLDKQSLLTDMNELIRLEIHIGAFESFNRKHKKANKTNRIRTIIFTTLVKETVNKKWDILNVANKIATNLAL